MGNFKYTWEMFDEDVGFLIPVLKKYGVVNCDVLVGLALGGLPLLVKLSNIMGIPYEIIKCSSYEGKTKKNFNIREVPLSIKDKKILLVDDISDTGGTLQEVIKRCQGVGVKEIKVVTLFLKPHTRERPDWAVREVSNSTWVIFPWE